MESKSKIVDEFIGHSLSDETVFIFQLITLSAPDTGYFNYLACSVFHLLICKQILSVNFSVVNLTI